MLNIELASQCPGLALAQFKAVTEKHNLLIGLPVLGKHERIFEFGNKSRSQAGFRIKLLADVDRKFQRPFPSCPVKLPAIVGEVCRLPSASLCDCKQIDVIAPFYIVTAGEFVRGGITGIRTHFNPVGQPHPAPLQRMIDGAQDISLFNIILFRVDVVLVVINPVMKPVVLLVQRHKGQITVAIMLGSR